jgi:5'-3' exonuclease
LIALVDGDIIVHRVGYTTNNDEEWVAEARSSEMLDNILTETSATQFEVWLSDARERTFRAALSADYKANRLNQPRPKHYDFIKGYLIRECGARIASEMEADDSLGIAQDKSGVETVICSIDKDLLQIPGQHYNFVKKEWACVTEWEGLVWFYKQILIGDSTDNVQGCKGIGPVKAGKALDQVSQKDGEQVLFQRVFDLYKKQKKGLQDEVILEKILLAGRLLKIRQKDDEELWHFPKLNPVQAPTLSSTVPAQVASIPSTEPISQETTSGLPLLGALTENTSKVDGRA